MIWNVDKDRLARGLYWQRSLTLVEGCTPVSEGCDNCWSASQTRIRVGQKNPKICGPKQGLLKEGHFNGTIRTRKDNLTLPIKAHKPTVWLVLNDLFHKDVPNEFIMEAFDIFSCATPACGKRHKHEEECWTGDPHTFLILTKRPERMLGWFTKDYLDLLEYWPGDSPANILMSFDDTWPPQNAYFGISAENQEQLDARMPYLVKLKQAFPNIKIFVSLEPLLGSISFRWAPWHNPGSSMGNHLDGLRLIDWVVLGGESGPKARPVLAGTVSAVRDECEEAQVPFLFKQWGTYLPFGQEDREGRHLSINDSRYRVIKGYEFHKTGKKDGGARLHGQEYKETP